MLHGNSLSLKQKLGFSIICPMSVNIPWRMVVSFYWWIWTQGKDVSWGKKYYHEVEMGLHKGKWGQKENASYGKDVASGWKWAWGKDNYSRRKWFLDKMVFQAEDGAFPRKGYVLEIKCCPMVKMGTWARHLRTWWSFLREKIGPVKGWAHGNDFAPRIRWYQ